MGSLYLLLDGFKISQSVKVLSLIYSRSGQNLILNCLPVFWQILFVACLNDSYIVSFAMNLVIGASSGKIRALQLTELAPTEYQYWNYFFW